MPSKTAQDSRIREGLEILRCMGVSAGAGDEMTMADIVDRIEIITTDPHVVRQVIETAEHEGIIEVERRDGRVTTNVSEMDTEKFRSLIITKEGEFSCTRCGQGLKKGYFIRRRENVEVGPFGPECVKKVTGVAPD